MCGGGQPGAQLLCSACPAPTPCVEALFPLWTCYVQGPGLSNIHSNFSSQPLNAVTYFSTNVPSLSTNVPSLRGKVILFYTFSAPLGGLGWRGDRWAWQSTLGNPRLPFVHGILTPISLGVFLLQSIPAGLSGSPVQGAECLPHAPSPTNTTISGNPRRKPRTGAVGAQKAASSLGGRGTCLQAPEI